jgi:O-acetyl-ADP-ribose deacetylase (regulator of RNase III)
MKQPQNLSYWINTLQSTSARIRHQARMNSTCLSLPKVASYQIPNTHPFHLVIARGSVVEFEYSNRHASAIVNAANEGCLGGGGVDGAISAAGGINLYNDREALPEVSPGVRCPTGKAVITGPNSYGELRTSHVIHAVGPNYLVYNSDEGIAEGDALLSSAYTSSLDRGKDAKLEAIAFSLLSAGVFRGSKSVEEVLTIGMKSIIDFDGYPELKDVYMCAFNQKEADALIGVANKLGLEEIA